MAENKEFDAIMNKITAGLTGDPEKDMKYLMETSEAYKEHQYGKEILRACGRMMYDLIPDDKKEELENAFNNDITGFHQSLEEARSNIQNKDFDKALDILGNMVSKYEEGNLFANDEVSEYFCFDEPMQEILYRHQNNPEKDLRRAGIDFMALYYLYGGVLVELGCVKEARAALEKAKRWNPASATVAFEYGETFKMEGDLDNFLKATREIYPYIYRKNDFARFYRNLGYYYIEKEDYFTAACCFLYSGSYEQHPMIASELMYIEQKTGKKLSPTMEELMVFFEENDIPLTISEEMLKIAYAYGKHFHDEGDMDATAYFWGIFVEFIQDAEVEKVLEEIANKEE